jgi:hypothetical protein
MKKKKILKNIDVEERDIFIKMSPADSLETKRDLLEINEAVIEMQITAEKFKQQRKEEMVRRNEAKKLVREMVMAATRMVTEMPKEIQVRIRKEKPVQVQEIQKPAPKKEIIIQQKREEIKPTKMSDLQKELENIKSKLSGL